MKDIDDGGCWNCSEFDESYFEESKGVDLSFFFLDGLAFFFLLFDLDEDDLEDLFLFSLPPPSEDLVFLTRFLAVRVLSVQREVPSGAI